MEVRVATNIQRIVAGDLITGTISGRDSSSRPILRTALGEIVLATSVPLARGNRVTLEVRSTDDGFVAVVRDVDGRPTTEKPTQQPALGARVGPAVITGQGGTPLPNHAPLQLGDVLKAVVVAPALRTPLTQSPTSNPATQFVATTLPLGRPLTVQIVAISPVPATGGTLGATVVPSRPSTFSLPGIASVSGAATAPIAAISAPSAPIAGAPPAHLPGLDVLPPQAGRAVSSPTSILPAHAASSPSARSDLGSSPVERRADNALPAAQRPNVPTSATGTSPVVPGSKAVTLNGGQTSFHEGTVGAQPKSANFSQSSGKNPVQPQTANPTPVPQQGDSKITVAVPATPTSPNAETESPPPRLTERSAPTTQTLPPAKTTLPPAKTGESREFSSPTFSRTSPPSAPQVSPGRAQGLKALPNPTISRAGSAGISAGSPAAATIESTGVSSSPRIGQLIPATVIAKDPVGRPLFHTPLGVLRGDSVALPTGETLTLRLIDLGVRLGAGGQKEELSSLRVAHDLARAWPSLRDAIEALERSDPNLARDTIERALPAPTPRLAASLLFFLSALRAGDLRGWLGREAVAILETAGNGEQLSRLENDFGQLNRANAHQASENGWRVLVAPFIDAGEIRPLTIFSRSQGEGKSAEEEIGTRFIVAIELSQFGELQLDGLIRDQRFDLILRSHTHLPEDFRRGVAEIFEQGTTATGYTGGMRFQVDASFPVSPWEEVLHPGGDSVLV